MRPLLCAVCLLSSLSAVAGPVDQNAALHALEQPGTLLIDVRSTAEFAAGALPGARNIAHTRIAAQIGEVTAAKDTPIVVYCRSGRRSSMAQEALAELGFTRVINGGGYEDLNPVLESRE
mgnify:CR=1 FL=1